MITAQDIREKTFEKSRMNGYDMASVDDFLEELAEDISNSQTFSHFSSTWNPPKNPCISLYIPRTRVRAGSSPASGTRKRGRN